MRKRLLSYVLALAMVFCMLPAQALAVEANSDMGTNNYTEQLPENDPADMPSGLENDPADMPNGFENEPEDESADILPEAMSMMLPAQASVPTPEEVLAAIVARLTESGISWDGNAPWFVADLMAYAEAYSIPSILSDEQIQDFLNRVIIEAGTASSAGDIAKYIVALRSLGYDPRHITNTSGDAINLVQKLTNMVDTLSPSGGAADYSSPYNIYSLPYALIALQQYIGDDYDTQIAKLTASAITQFDSAQKGWLGWSGSVDIDATNSMISALVPYYADSEIKEIIDPALEVIEGEMLDDGSLPYSGYGSAASTGLAMAAFASVGISPASITTNGSVSLVDGLLGFWVPTAGAFYTYLYEYDDYWNITGISGTYPDAFSTEQGFRGLLSSVQVESDSPYRIYDFAANPLNALSAVQAEYSPVFFNVFPTGKGAPTITVTTTPGGVTQNITTGGFYDLTAGAYHYVVSLSNYTTESGSFNVSSDEASYHLHKTINVSLAYIPSSGNSDITVTVYVKAPSPLGSGYTYKNNSDKYSNFVASQPVTLKSGNSAFDALDKAMKQVGKTYVENKFNGYVISIDGLSELDYGPNSGWMFRVGNTSPTVGSRDYTLNSNATVTWFYTEDFSSDYGSETWSNGNSNSGSGNTAAAGQDTVTSVIESKPEVTNGKATADIKASDITSALKDVQTALEKAKTDGKTDTTGEVVLNVAPKQSADTVDVNLAVSAIKAVADAKVLLTINTGVSTVTFDAAAITSAIGDVSGSENISLSTGKVENSELTDEQKKIVGDNPVFEFTLTVGDKAITDFGGGTATVVIPYTPKEGEDTSNLTVYYLADDGTVRAMKGAKYDKSTGGLVFTTSHFSKFFVGIAQDGEWTDNPFADIKSNDWFYNAVRYASENNLMSGTASNAFSPNTPMTRAMLVTVLYKYAGQPVVTDTNSFTDVKSGQWYTNAVIWANANDIASGYGNGLFGINDNITREQFVTILCHYADKNGLDTSKTTDLSTYSDAGQTSAWALDAVKWANAEGLLNGRSATSIAPRGNTTRAEAASILMHYIEDFEK